MRKWYSRTSMSIKQQQMNEKLKNESQCATQKYERNTERRQGTDGELRSRGFGT
jgi:hypothetical protein